ncbi:MAG: hypothetical protein IPP29_15040 [Bacteroidetes bacterium]|nr:hypothetical protein [Bacteroidota bacterium]
MNVAEVMTKENLVTVTGVTNLQKAEVIILMKYKSKTACCRQNNKLIGLITYKRIL